MAMRKDLMNEVFDGAIVSAGVVALSMVSRKLLGEKLVDATTIKDTVKLALGVIASTMLVKYAQTKKWIPEDPFKSA